MKIKINLKLISIILIFIILSGAILLFFRNNNNSKYAFKSLLDGGTNIYIEKVIIEGQGYQFGLNDQESNMYLTNLFRNSKYEGYVPSHNGRSYNARIKMRDHGHVNVEFSPVLDATKIGIAFDVDGYGYDPVYYLVTLNEPIPQRLLCVLNQMK